MSKIQRGATVHFAGTRYGTVSAFRRQVDGSRLVYDTHTRKWTPEAHFRAILGDGGQQAWAYDHRLAAK